MCLIVVALGAAPRYPLVVAANRDEQHARPTRAAAWWSDAPHVVGGRDLQAGGTWLAMDRRGRFAAVTNIRDPNRPIGLRSRGSLVADFLLGSGVRRGLRGASRGARRGVRRFPFARLRRPRALRREQSRSRRDARPRHARVQQRAARRRVAEGRERACRHRAGARRRGARRDPTDSRCSRNATTPERPSSATSARISSWAKRTARAARPSFSSTRRAERRSPNARSTRPGSSSAKCGRASRSIAAR